MSIGSVGYNNQMRANDSEEDTASDENEKENQPVELASHVKEINLHISQNRPLQKSGSGSIYKLSKKESKLPKTVVAIQSPSGSTAYYLHMKQSIGEGFFKRAYSAVGMTVENSSSLASSTERLEVVHKKLKSIPDPVKRKERIANTIKETELQIELSKNHPSIVKIHGWYSNEKNVVIYEEACDCSLLDQLKDSADSLSYNDKLAVFTHVADAIEHLHDNGYAHNDIKLNNLLIKEVQESQYEGKLADFGVCKPLGEPFYGYTKICAPENRHIPFGESHIGNEKTDAFQFGLCLWHAFHPNPPGPHLEKSFNYGDISLDQPFTPEVLQEMLRLWACTQPQDQQMRTLVENCLNPNPNGRPCMKEIHETLNSLRASPIQSSASSIT